MLQLILCRERWEAWCVTGFVRANSNPYSYSSPRAVIRSAAPASTSTSSTPGRPDLRPDPPHLRNRAAVPQALALRRRAVPPELGEIVAMFVRTNGVRNVNLPTNGLMPDSSSPPSTRSSLSARHRDRPQLLARRPGQHARLDPRRAQQLRPYARNNAAAEQRYKGNRKVRRNVLTVITRENYGEIVRLGLHMLEETHSTATTSRSCAGRRPTPRSRN